MGKYADRVRAASAKPAKPAPQASPEMLGTGMASRAGKKIRDRGAQIDAAVDEVTESQIKRR